MCLYVFRYCRSAQLSSADIAVGIIAAQLFVVARYYVVTARDHTPISHTTHSHYACAAYHVCIDDVISAVQTDISYRVI